MKNLGLLAYSGGLDSTTLLYDMKNSIGLCVGFNYGANHNKKEIEAAREICKIVGVKYLNIDLIEIFKHTKSALLSGSSSIPNGKYTAENQSEICVPFRNGIFLSILASIAESNDLSTIYLASHNNDSAIYPDCTKDFNEAMAAAVKLGTYKGISFRAPYEDLSKEQIAQIGLILKVPFEKTYSCYKGGEIHCGVCPTCIERREALGIFDKTEYAE